MIALDANLFIYMLEANPEFGPASHAIFLAIERGEVQACASAMTIMEVLSHQKLSEAVAAQAYVELQTLGVQFLPISEAVLLEAARLRRHFKLGAIDSVHVASALLAGCTQFVTNDLPLLKRHVPDIKLVALTDYR